jgi:hypothetical protein
VNLAGVVVVILIVVVGLVGLAAVAGVVVLMLRSGKVGFEELPVRRSHPESALDKEN